MKRENLEWTQTWWEQANDGDLPRVLLVGDSIVCGYRPFVQQELRGKAYVDQFASSKYIADPFYQKEIMLYAKEYSYDLIHFNHGLHGLGYSPESYRDNLKEILQMLSAGCPRMMLALSTPITVKGDNENLAPENDVVIRRNEEMKAIAEELSLPLNDLYTAMISRPEFRVGDGYHYNEQGMAAQARLVACRLKEML